MEHLKSQIKMKNEYEKGFPQQSVEDCLNSLYELVNGFQLKGIVYSHEKGLFYHLLPSKTLDINSDKYKGRKKIDYQLSHV